MNRLTIIGNLTADPVTNSTNTGKDVCNFTVAVNRRKTQQNQNPEADFFRVSAWNELGKNCQQYLSKGKKVCVMGPVSVNTYTGQDGVVRASMNVQAIDVEFLTPKGDGLPTPAQTTEPLTTPPPAQQTDPSGATVVDTDELPF